MARIVIYETQDDILPQMRFLARGVVNGTVMPVFFVGASREEVTGKLQDFWIKERQKHRPDADPWRELGIDRPAAMAQATVEPVPTSLMDLLV